MTKDSPEYQTSSEKFRKQTENGYAYYIIEDIGEEYEESGNSQSKGIQIVKVFKAVRKRIFVSGTSGIQGDG